MDNQNIIADLKRQLAARTQRVAEEQLEISKLSAAIDALEGNLPTASKSARNGHRGSKMIEMIEGAVRMLVHESEKPDVVFDHKIVVRQAQAMFPGHDDELRRRVYSSFVGLLKKKKIQRVPGGFSLCP